MLQRPFVVIGLGWLAGSMISYWLWKNWLGYIVFFILVMVIGGWVFYYYRRGLMVTLFLIGIFLGAARFAYVDQHNHSMISSFCTETCVGIVTGKVISQPIVDGDRVTFDMDVSYISNESTVHPLSNERIRVAAKLKDVDEWRQAQTLQRYDYLRGTMVIERPSPPRNPGAFHYQEYLYRQQIHWIGKMDGWKPIVQSSSSFHLRVELDHLQAHLSQQLDTIFSQEHAGLMKGMLLGQREQVDEDTQENYQQLGIIHILSISGLHVGVIVSCLYVALKWIGLTREKAALVTLCVLPLYAMLVGAGVPVIRASLMGGLALLAIYLNKWKDMASFLAIALIVQLLWNPYQWLEVGFQLSYLVTFALIIGVEELADRLPLDWSWLRSTIAVMIIAQVVSFPILIWHFQQFSFISWLANLLFVPVLSLLVLPIGMGSLFLSFINSSLAKGIALFPSLVLDGVDQGVDLLMAWSWAHTSWVPPSLLWLLAYIIILLYLWGAWVKSYFVHSKHRWISMGFLVALFVYAHQIHLWEREETRITFLDVGQGDAIIIETKDGKVIMIDGGGSVSYAKEKWQQRTSSYDVGKRVLVPYLSYRGIRQIDQLILTHGDADHIGGLLAVVERFPVKQVIRNPHPPRSLIEAMLINSLEKQGVPIGHVPSGKGWQLESGVSWQFLHPDSKQLLSDGKQTNEDSVVVLLQVYGVKILLTGDIGKQAEQFLLTHWDLPSVDVLKVAHHGSRTSTHEPWLSATQPKHAVISVGKQNRFGHPTPDVLQRLEQHQAIIWRTDEQGAISVRVDPSGKYQLEAMIK
ncbi:DNA internalization-related competence protein ComEC/Rec2 [Hazenella coriacea]|uniref:Competence protein ComEC n=1 Tax=Hazenella coriacea TaxID=1179467 RepID=A0A4R3L4T8_9BACL|nr:DNA internalization-related competence protein ComEC/Rec2 [Hazenella coriacea]TCS94791.1 competence protein ComEC [Hazenella coriacea]